MMNVQHLGLVDYATCLARMQAWTLQRQPTTEDALWLCQHPSVFTLGQAGLTDHVLDAGPIPVVKTDRGGQVTFHGPGQWVAYPLLDMRRKGYFVKELVYRLEEVMIRTLGTFGLVGHRVKGAAGVYVDREHPQAHARTYWTQESLQNHPTIAKIGALGIKISRHCSYHGLALNVAMDLHPYTRINPCGYQRLQVADMQGLGADVSMERVLPVLQKSLDDLL